HIAGPGSRSLLEKITEADVSNESLPFLSGHQMTLAGTPEAIVVRVSFTGELGYELYCPAADQPAVYDSLRLAGEEFGLRLVGSHALMSLRLEKSFPSWGLDLGSDYYPDESGMGRFVAPDKGDFIGRDALIEQRESGPREKIATFIVDADNADAYSGEPIYCNGELAGYVTSGGFGYRVEKSLALGYLSAEFHKPGNHFESEILGDMRPAEMTDGPVYDPTGLRMKA
ncbi:MAG: aminomethyl transferase family protein, partial [Gammaproteobacteria bacterium]|nr:aminomethyl transferase family protein [Gammaproteobacteria bacterium]